MGRRRHCPELPPAPQVHGVARECDRRFIAKARADGVPMSDKPTPENLALARGLAKETYSHMDSWNDAAVLVKVREKLRQPNICAALGDSYEERGFTEVDAIDAHIAHIRGIEHEVIDAKGERRAVKAPPSYPALRDYQRMVFPQEARRVQVGSRNLNVIVSPDEPRRVGPPPTRCRQLPGGRPSEEERDGAGAL